MTSRGPASTAPQRRQDDLARSTRFALGAHAARAGMTLFEIMFAVLIIFLVMGLLIGAIRMVTGSAKETAHRTAVLSLKQGVDHFQQEFGFLPPLVKDTIRTVTPTNPPTYTFGGSPINPPQVSTYSIGRDIEFFRHLAPSEEPDFRFSIYTLPYYLVGVADQARGGSGPQAQLPIDGVNGPGFRTPMRDGTFEHSGRTFPPFFSVGSGSTTLYTQDYAEGRVELRDSSGIAYRYYRWEPKANPLATDSLRERLRIPYIVGDPDENPALRNAKYAIIGAGPNGLFGNEAQIHARDPSHPQALTWTEMARRLGVPISSANPTTEEANELIRIAIQDNIVEVGQ
jgi:type II secretory pathway pseudopilin PulG